MCSVYVDVRNLNPKFYFEIYTHIFYFSQNRTYFRNKKLIRRILVVCSFQKTIKGKILYYFYIIYKYILIFSVPESSGTVGL